MKRLTWMLALLAGCAQHGVEWGHPTKTDADFARDEYECKRELQGFGTDTFQSMSERCMKLRGWTVERRGYVR